MFSVLFECDLAVSVILYPFFFHSFRYGHLLLCCCCGKEEHWIWLQRSQGEEIMPHWFGEICRLEHSHRISGDHECY